MNILLISSLHTGGKEKRFKQLRSFLNEKNIEMESIVFKNLNNNSSNKFPLIVQRIYSLYKLLFKYKPKVIHSWSSYLTLICSPYCFLYNVKLIDSSISTNGKDGSISFKIIRRLAIIISNHLTVNSLVAILNLKLSSKVILIRNAIKINSHKKLVRRNGNLNFWFVSRLEPGKRVDLFIKIASQLNKFYPEFEFNIVGDGSLMSSYLKKYNNLSFLKFRGYDSDFLKKIHKGDICMLISDSEGTPNILLEFMSVGIPPIYYNLETDIDSPILNNFTGFNVNSLEDLESKVIELYNNPVLYDEMSKNAVKHVLKNYNINKNFNRFIELYYK
jgi:glycosyltransferase involved in cell wall biosynthesis